MPRGCCVVNCVNNSAKDPRIKLYRFPKSAFKAKQLDSWIKAIGKYNKNMLWRPREHHYICSAHFIGNQKSDNQFSPSFAPTIFPFTNEKSAANVDNFMKRHERFMVRRLTQISLHDSNNTINDRDKEIPTILVDILQPKIVCQNSNLSMSQECQVDFLSESTTDIQTMFSARSCNNGVCEAETQTNIHLGLRVIVSNRKSLTNKACGTSCKEYIDAQVGPNVPMNAEQCCQKGFLGVTTIKREQQLLALTGVSYDVFVLLLTKGLIGFSLNCKKEKANILLIFLMKLKTGLTYSALGVLFDVDRRTVQRYFTSILHHLTSALIEEIVWPPRDIVRKMIPECFKPDFLNVRTILDCTEFSIEMPISNRVRVLTYSHYKKTLTTKVLIGCTPNCLITFKSKCAGGRKSDTQMLVDSNFLELIEDGDTVLTDKGFPRIETHALQHGKSLIVLKPPLLDNPEFTEEQTEDTYAIAKVRIHVERVIQRLKNFKILSNRIPIHLLKNIDYIVHVCCVLVNLQPPIIRDDYVDETNTDNEDVHDNNTMDNNGTEIDLSVHILET